MRRAYLILALVSVIAAAGIAAVAHAPRPPDSTQAEPARRRVTLHLTLRAGLTDPQVSTVRKGWLVALTVLNRDDRPVRFTLTGYEDRVSAARIAPDSSWRATFLADRPGDEFEWQVDDRTAGRFIVLGSHLEQGHE
ncbi:MAG TPA: hypothetical protein VI792_07550 [Candidatus Eisenbacteria bacterium]